MMEAKGSGCREDETVVGRILHGADTLPGLVGTGETPALTLEKPD